MSHWEANGKTDDWYTPRYIFDAMAVRFDLDVSAPQEGPRHVPCERWFYEKSLEAEWSGFVWMNPPFGGRNGIEPWLRKFIAHGDGVALMPDRTSAPWFQACVPLMETVLFVSPKVKFERPDGTTGDSPGNGTVLASIGPKGDIALRRAALIGGLGWLARSAYPNKIAA